jgi:citronellol/citronellal dehydrogenase
MLKDKTIFITGASRGIGREIALRCAKDGANIVIAAKTTEPHPQLAGTIYSVAEEITAVGGKALPLPLDIRDEEKIATAVETAVNHFGGIDILVNNASAISLTPTLKTAMKRFDLMVAVNVRGTFAVTQACIPHLQQGANPHILTLSPPLNMQAKWFKDHLAYTMSKYGMSMCTLGWAEEFRAAGIAANSLWPKTTIATAAVEVHFPKEILLASRKPTIVADAAYCILTSPSKEVTGNFFIDEEVLKRHGISDFSVYAYSTKSNKLYPDLYLD